MKGYKLLHPFCVDIYNRHKGQVRATQHVDHIKRTTGADDPQFWNPANHQGLCASCHSWKTVHVDGGLGHERQINDNKAGR